MIFDPELDIIDICLPTFLHTEYAIMAMEAGKNVFIEKPVCLTPEEADKLLDAQKRTGAKVQV
ncbi:MAG: Gfo/Idh/MocA family oxidoreductase, partial [Clostridia bacterium]|nr:Gfo/Idh/MocA family oxidoreductase [Clostridia bacterium]